MSSNKELKLDYKKTILVGLAFLAICSFWQMYDAIIPMILTNTFSLPEDITGTIMAADNVLALVLLPFFGSLSDKTNTKIGKRMPYILAGTIVSVIFVNVIPLLDNKYAVSPSTATLTLFIVCLGALLVSMGTYRSPAVALMPDVTPKPLRSKANAVINLMGAVGGIIYLGIASIMYPSSKVEAGVHVNYYPLFLVVSLIMAISVIVLFITIKEPKLTKENEDIEKEHPEWNLTEENQSGDAKLPKDVKFSLGFLFASIALWYIGYNGVTTWFSTYINNVMGEGIGGSSFCLLIATGGAIVSYIPIGMIASKIGRKKVILIGACLLGACFALAFVLTSVFTSINFIMYVVFAIVGFAWAAINVNSLPMVVEMCKGSDIGKFTGYYYTASMSAQVVTPILSGFLLRNVSYKVLFPYAAFFVFCSFVTMLFVKHGDAKPEAKKGLDAFEEMDD